MSEHFDGTLTFYPTVAISEPIGWRELSFAPSIEDIRDALKAPVPHAAEVPAVVARHWHLGLAEDAERRQAAQEGLTPCAS